MVNILFIPLAFLILFGISFSGKNDPFSKSQTTSLRGIACIIVVLHHLSQLLISRSAPFSLFAAIGYLPVSFFFCISGYGLMKSFCSKPDYCKTVFAKRIPTLALEYFWFILLYYATSFLFTPVSPLDVVRSLFNGHPIVTDSWYILLTLVLYLAFAIIGTVSKSKASLLTLGVLCFTILWIVVCKAIAFPLNWYMTCIVFPFGMFFALFEEKIEPFIQKYYWASLILCSGSFLVSFIIIYFRDILPFVLYNLSGVLFMLSLYICLLKVKIDNIFLRFLGKISLELYLIHRIFINVFRSEYIYLKNDTVWCICVLTCSIIAATILHFSIGKIRLDLSACFKKKTDNR